jgi:Amt family ammonium transporter
MCKGVGATPQASLAPAIPLALFALFQVKFAIITPALITGAFAARVQFSSYMLFVCLFSLLIYCPLAHWTWQLQVFLRECLIAPAARLCIWQAASRLLPELSF